ncbi:MAG TPA: hydrolase [Pseudonocardiaceae bacterium]
MTDDPWQTNQVLARLPTDYRAVHYVGTRFPGSPAVAASPGLRQGANCQLFAYAILRYFGLNPPPVRSSELWADEQTTMRVSVAQPLDLVLVNGTSDAWGAHVGVWVGDEGVLHLCAEVGRPAVWPMSEFAARHRYRTLIGIKRVRA